MKIQKVKKSNKTKLFNGRKSFQEEEIQNDFDLENFEIKNSLKQLNQSYKKGKKNDKRAKEITSTAADVHASEDEKELELYLKMQSNSQSDSEDDEIVPVEFANQTTAILSRLEDIRIPDLEFIDQVSLTSKTTTASLITAVDDDLSRELAFYQQALSAATEARDLIIKAGIPFSRPSDYFAEMIKSDDHMVKVREKLLAQETSIMESEKAKKQRDLKKFGKQVQVSKLLERQKEKKSVLEKVKGMRRKGVNEDVDFDVQLEDQANTVKKTGTFKERDSGKKRAGKNAKFGFGGAKRYAKQNTRESTSDLSSFSTKKMKDGHRAGGSKARVGKKTRK